jgi:hypothetical protein
VKEREIYNKRETEGKKRRTAFVDMRINIWLE